MSDLFNIYEDKLNIQFSRLNHIIDTFSNLSKEQAESALQDANTTIKEAEGLVLMSNNKD